MANDTLYRLADHAAAEPLIDQWVAWPHTFSPLPYSLHLRNYQLKVLASYLENPDLHIKACANPRMLGGSFVNIPRERVPEVTGFFDHLTRSHCDDLDLARVFVEFHNSLTEQAKGQSLEPYYAKLPDLLQGYVELVYDYYGHPIVRCFEGLLYTSPHYKKDLQSLRLFSQTRDETRPFYMSTPRLRQQDLIDWSVPFDDQRVDELFKLDLKPQPLDAVRALLDLEPADDHRLLPLLSQDAAPPPEPYRGQGIRVRYLGHACVLVEWDGASVLTDPFIPVVPKEGGITRFTYRDLPPYIDYVLITHGHHDHFVFESLLRLRHRIGCLVVPKTSGLFHGDISLQLMARHLGFGEVRELGPLDSIAFPPGEIIAIPFLGEHSDLPHSKTGYVVRGGREKILFAADSNCLDKHLYQHIGRIVGPIQTVFLGMECIGAPLSWVYGPLLPIKPDHKNSQARRSRGCDARAALDLLDSVRSERVYIYALGREPWLQYFMALTPTEDDLYVREAAKVLEACRTKGYGDAKCLFAAYEFYLNQDPLRRAASEA